MNDQNERGVMLVRGRQSYRVLNALLGFGMAAAIAFGIEYSEYSKATGLILLAVPIAGLLLEYIIIRLFKPDFEVRFLWVNVGAAAGVILIMPLVITPKCGWNNDQCKPAVHHQTTQQHVPQMMFLASKAGR